MTVRKENLVIEQGSTIHFSFQLYDANGDNLSDSTGYFAQSDIRQTLESNTIYSFETSVGGGVVNLDMTAEYSATIEPDNYYYTVELLVGDKVSRIVEGMATVQPTYVWTSSNVVEPDPPMTPLPPPTPQTQPGAIAVQQISNTVNAIVTPDPAQFYRFWSTLPILFKNTGSTILDDHIFTVQTVNYANQTFTINADLSTEPSPISNTGIILIVVG